MAASSREYSKRNNGLLTYIIDAKKIFFLKYPHFLIVHVGC